MDFDDVAAIDREFLELLEALAPVAAAAVEEPLPLPPPPCSVVADGPATPTSSEVSQSTSSGSSPSSEDRDHGPGRRRINVTRERMKRELAELRALTAGLEAQLAGLQREQQRTSETEAKRAINATSTGTDEAAVVAAVTAFWQRHATRERTERQRALTENTRLRELVADSTRTVRALQRVLYQQTTDTHFTAEQRLCAHLDHLHFDEHERATIDAALVRNFDLIHERLDALLIDSGLAQRFSTFQAIHVRPNGGGSGEPARIDGDSDAVVGEVLEFQDARILPFDLWVTDLAGWRSMQQPILSSRDGVYLAEECVGDLIRAKFGYVTTLRGREVFCRGRLVARRHLEADRSVIVCGAWVAAEGGPLGGDRIEILDEGWSVLQRLPGTQFSISKDCFLTRCHVPSGATPERRIELQELASVVHRAYCEIIIRNYQYWEGYLLQEAPRLLAHAPPLA